MVFIESVPEINNHSGGGTQLRSVGMSVVGGGVTGVVSQGVFQVGQNHFGTVLDEECQKRMSNRDVGPIGGKYSPWLLSEHEWIFVGFPKVGRERRLRIAGR